MDCLFLLCRDKSSSSKISAKGYVMNNLVKVHETFTVKKCFLTCFTIAIAIAMAMAMATILLTHLDL